MIKSPNAKLDFGFNWRPKGEEWLQDDETITSYVIAAPAGITKEGDSESDGVVTVWLSGGTVNTEYCITCNITTSAGRTDDRSMRIQVENR